MRVACAVLLLLGSGVCLPPIIIIPGDGSNQLEAKLDKPSAPHVFCSKKSDWFRIWLNLEILIQGVIDCWCDNIALDVNSTTGRATNMPGVQVRVPGVFGSTSALEELDPLLGSHSAAFLYMLQAITELGYQKNNTLRGAPYDFRYTPDSDSGYGVALKALIEASVNSTRRKAILISHSMGGLQTLYFLNSQSVAWKAAHIAHWIPISAPLGGAAKEMRLFGSGDAQGLPVKALTIRGEQRSYETNHWLMPVAAVWKDTLLVQTAVRNYTSEEIEEYMVDIGYPTGKKVYPRVAGLLPTPMQGPGVPVSCLYSKGVDTPLSFYYSDGFDQQPVTSTGDGDGTVNLLSLQVCDLWKQTQSEPVSVTVLDGISHSDMITNTSAIAEVIAIIKSLM